MSLTKEVLEEIIDRRLQPFQQKISELSTTVEEFRQFISFSNNQYDDHSKKVDKLLMDFKDLTKESSMLKSETYRLANEMKQFSDRLNELEQYSRRDCVEIRGVPINPHHEENTDDIVVKVAKLMDVTITEQDISISHRLPQAKDSKYHPTIIAKFQSRKKREIFYKSRANLKNKSTKDLDITYKFHNNIYINESLTKRNQDLFKVCLKAKKSIGLQSVWSNNGKIFLKENQDSRPIIIKSSQDLEDQFGYYI